jgi:hypothetical protein
MSNDNSHLCAATQCTAYAAVHFLKAPLTGFCDSLSRVRWQSATNLFPFFLYIVLTRVAASIVNSLLSDSDDDDDDGLALVVNLITRCPLTPLAELPRPTAAAITVLLRSPQGAV